MYKQRNKTYSDAGKYLKCGNRVAYEFGATTSEITEVADTLQDFTKVGCMITWSNGYRAIKVIENGTYADYKTRMIKARYSNDDQIAIILNKDSGNEDDRIAYERMQAWREYAAQVATKIMEIL